MPLIKRMIEPIELSRAHIDQGIRNELECVTNNTLSNVIRQLSSLSKHAEDMFDELTKEATIVFQRSNNLQDRIDKLRIKVTQLDSTVAVVSLQEINMRKPFKSSVIREQQIISRESRPRAVQESYEKCDAPPALSKLNPYREDGKDSMKFYTDSTYFFELWRAEMEKDTENQRQIVKQKGQRKMHHTHHYDVPNVQHAQRRPDHRAPQPIKQVQPRNFTEKAKGVEFEPSKPTRRPEPQTVDNKNYNNRPNSLEFPKDGQYITPSQGAQPGAQNAHAQNHVTNGPVYNSAEQPHPNAAAYAAQTMSDDNMRQYQPGSDPASLRGSVTSMHSPGRPDGRPMSRPPPPPAANSPSLTGSHSSSRDLPTPPLPPPLNDSQASASPTHLTSHENTPSPHVDDVMTPGSVSLPPHPPPPPPFPGADIVAADMLPPPPSPPGVPVAMPNGAPPMPPPLPPPAPVQHSPQQKQPQQKKPSIALPAPQDGRSDLLEAIRRGIQLREVQQKEEDQSRRQSKSKLDVQSIMEAAFEMRRRAVEDDDSDTEDDDDPDWD